MYDRNEVNSGLIWNDYISKATKQPLETNMPFTFNAHLPFSFQVDEDHGSKLRQASYASNSNILFKKNIEDTEYLFSLDLLGGGVLEKMIEFKLGELDSIKLVKIEDSEFSPKYNGYRNPQKPSISALEHYLKFKGFKLQEIGKFFSEDSIPSEHKDVLSPIIENVLVPDHPTLLNYKNDELNGFVAIKTEGGILLYEFIKLKLSKDFTNIVFHDIESVYSAYAIAHKANYSNNIKVHRGDDAIAKLHEYKTIRSF